MLGITIDIDRHDFKQRSGFSGRHDPCEGRTSARAVPHSGAHDGAENGDVMATKNPVNNHKTPGDAERTVGAHEAARAIEDVGQHSPRGQDTQRKELNRDPIARACIHASPRAWLAWLTPIPDDAGTPQRLDTQGTFINRIPDVLYRVPTTDREWIICVEAQSYAHSNLGRRFRLALLSYLMDVPTIDPFPRFVPVELRTKRRSRTRRGRAACLWSEDNHDFTWACSNDLLQNTRRLEQLELTLDTVTIHAWHKSTTLEVVAELGTWTRRQSGDRPDKWHLLVLLGLISRVRFGVRLRWLTGKQEYVAMNQLKEQNRMDSELIEHLEREYEEHMQEREARGIEQGRGLGREEGREEERATLLSLAAQLLPDRLESLQKMEDLAELRRVVKVAVADLTKSTQMKPNGSR